MSRITPQNYQLRCATHEIIQDLLQKKLLKTEKEALEFVIVLSDLKGACTGFPPLQKSTLEKIYKVYTQFKYQYQAEQSIMEVEIIIT